MREEEAVIVVFALVIGAIIAMWSVYYTKRAATASARLDVMKKALEHPGIDDRTKQQLVNLLAEQQRQEQRPFLDRLRGATGGSFGDSLAGLRRVARIALLGIGWILFLFGGCILLLHWADFWPSHAAAPFEFSIMTVIGLVMMTLPSAVRELTRRDRKAATDQ